MHTYDATFESLFCPENKELVLDLNQCGEWAIRAELARIAYIKAEESEDRLAQLKTRLNLLGYIFNHYFHGAHTGAYAFAATRINKTATVLVFRGTQPQDISDLVTNLNVIISKWPSAPGGTHTGFAKAFDSIAAHLDAWSRANAKTEQLHLLGHSLGGAMATLASFVFPDARATTFGCPKVGNQEFSAAVDRRRVTRVVNCCDIVCELPPSTEHGYAHHDHVCYLSSDGKSYLNPSADFFIADRQLGRAAYLSNISWRPGSLPVRELSDHSPVNYVNSLVGKTP